MIGQDGLNQLLSARLTRLRLLRVASHHACHTLPQVANDDSAESHKGAWEVALSMLSDLVSDSGDANLYQGEDLDDDDEEGSDTDK